VTSSEATLDLRGLKCPLPALFARRVLERAKPATTLEVLTDDPMAIVDVPHMCRQEGFEVLVEEKTAGGARFLLRKNA
jgi:tRNA 2-thiouridine synthesizing protein A